MLEGATSVVHRVGVRDTASGDGEDVDVPETIPTVGYRTCRLHCHLFQSLSCMMARPDCY
jgi:hypothetical protein